MPRSARKESSSSIYHVVARGASHQIIFEESEDRAFFMKRAAECIENGGGIILAWCLMDNHIHLLLKITHEALSVAMHGLFTSYSGYFNRVHGRSGTLFEDRFHSEPVETDEYLKTVVRYIHLNPVKAELSNTPSYPWSSYIEYVSGKAFWTSTGLVLNMFETLEEFIRFHRDVQKEAHCLDIPEHAPRRVSDNVAKQIAERVLGKEMIGLVKALPRQQRDASILQLKDAGLSLRQIQRLTGVSLGTISQLRQ